MTNWTASIAEDLLVIGGIWTALNYPWLFIGALIIFICLMIWLLPKVWKNIKRLFSYIKNTFKGNPASQTAKLNTPSTTQSDD